MMTLWHTGILIGAEGKIIQAYVVSFLLSLTKARYFPNNSIWEANKDYVPSFMWPSIWEARQLIEEGGQWRIWQWEKGKYNKK